MEEVPEIADLPEPKRKARPTPDAVIGSLFEILPIHVSEAIRATLYFGFRRSEVFALKIGHVDFDAGGIRLSADEVKDAEDAFLPGGRDAMQFMAQLVDQARDRGTPYLFTWRRKLKDEKAQQLEKWRPIVSPKSAWRTAMKSIEKQYGKRWRWHDLRAAYITDVAMRAGPLAAQTLARHSDFETTQGYIEVANEVTRAAAEAITARPSLRIVAVPR